MEVGGTREEEEPPRSPRVWPDTLEVLTDIHQHLFSHTYIWTEDLGQ